MGRTERIQVLLECQQKRQLETNARVRGNSVAGEIRRAVGAYLAGVAARELQLLDEGSRRAGEHLADMTVELDRLNGRLDSAFAKLSRRPA